MEIRNNKFNNKNKITYQQFQNGSYQSTNRAAGSRCRWIVTRPAGEGLRA